jgi:S-DNA-T family DNA segregation ATPase FtsK/SpoIIIE
VAAFNELALHLEAAWPGLRAPAVDTLPDSVEMAAISAVAPSLAQTPIAIASDDFQPRAIDLAERHVLVAGPYRSGRSNALGVIALQALRAEPSLELQLFAPRRTPLLDFKVWHGITRGADGCIQAARQLAERAAQMSDQATSQLLVVIDDAGEIHDAATWFALEQLVRLGRDRGIRMAVGSETGAARMLTNPWLREMRKDGHGLLLMPESLSDGELLGVTLPRRQPVAMRPGRGFLATRGQATLVQVPLLDDHPTPPSSQARVSTPGEPESEMVALKRLNDGAAGP